MLHVFPIAQSCFPCASRFWLSWFYDFWLSVSTSTSQHHSVYWELKSKCFSSGYLSGREEELWSPRAFLSTVTIPAQGNRFKGAGHLTCPSSRLAMFPVRSAHYCCSQLHARLQYQCKAFGSRTIFLSILIILYYNVLSCILILYLVNQFVSPQIVATVFNYFGVPCFPFSEARIL